MNRVLPAHGTAIVGIGLTFVSCVTADKSVLISDREAFVFAPSAEPASPQESEPTVREAEAPLTGQEHLQSYIHIALQRNSELRGTFDTWVATMEKIPQVTALPDPQFSWTYFIEEVQTRTGPQEYTLSLSQKFPWFGKLQLAGEASAHRAESLWYEVEAARLTVMRDVKNAYFEYAYLAQAIRLIRENLALLQSLEPIIQRRVQVGANQSDLIRLQVEIGKLENELATLEAFRTALSARLRAVLNLPGRDPLPWPPQPDSTISSFDIKGLRDRFAQLNPQLTSIIWQIEWADTLAQRARLDGFPDITLGATYIATSNAGPLPMPPDSAEPRMFPEGRGDDPYSVTLGMNVPIWRQKYRAGVREARAMQSSFEHELTQTRHDLLSELDMNIYELDDAARQLSFYQNTLIPRAQQALELTEIAYESGNANILDIIDAQQELLAFEKAYWRFLATYHQRLADLELLCGGSLP